MGDKKCDFRISRTILQQEVNPEQVRLILTQGKSGLMTDFVSARTKRKFKAFLVWDARVRSSVLNSRRERREPKAQQAKQRRARKFLRA